MSAFIVSYAVIDDVVDLIEGGTVKRKRTAIGRQLLRMNVDAVCHRYDDPSEKYDDVIANYEYMEGHERASQRTKSLQCYLYQCSEGDVHESLPFLALDALLTKLLGLEPATNDDAWCRGREKGILHVRRFSTGHVALMNERETTTLASVYDLAMLPAILKHYEDLGYEIEDDGEEIVTV